MGLGEGGMWMSGGHTKLINFLFLYFYIFYYFFLENPSFQIIESLTQHTLW